MGLRTGGKPERRRADPREVSRHPSGRGLPGLPNIRILKVDYAEGTRQAVQHLAALGHRRIAFVSGPLRLRSAIARRDAFLKSMAELGLTVPAEHMVEGDHTMEGGLVAMERLASLSDLPTAVQCS